VSKRSKNRRQTIQDEIEAEEREGARQALVEEQRLLDIAEQARREAIETAPDSANDARLTFLQKIKRWLLDEGV
jgi:hypothetical protein